MFQPPLDSEALEELSKLAQWVLWRYEERKGNLTKIPYSPHTLGPASTTRKQTWSTLDKAVDAAVHSSKSFDGVGFVFTDEDPYVGIDLDKCVDKKGNIQVWALEIIEALNSYTEYSPSGGGFHIFIKSKKPNSRCRVKRLEIYSTGRYFTFTGNRYEKTSEKIEVRQESFYKIFNKYLERDPEKPPPVEVSDLDLNESLDALKFTALLSNNPKFKKSWEHKRESSWSLSEYDVSLASFAAYAGWSDNQIAALMISHRLNQGTTDKTKRVDYLQRQIAKARAGVIEGHNDLQILDTQSIEAAASDPEKCLGVISEALGISIQKILKRGLEEAHYYFVVEDKDILIGKSENLFSINAVRNRIFDTEKLMIKNVSQKKWSSYFKLFECIIEDDLEFDLNRKKETLGMLEDYLSESGFFQEISWHEALESNDPFMKDGKIWFHAMRLLKFLMGNPIFDKNTTKSELLRRLREISMISKSFSHKAIGRYYWGIKSEQIEK